MGAKGTRQISWASMLLLVGCAQPHWVSDYDPVIDQGITDFGERLNVHVMDMIELAGTPQGSYAASFRAYNKLDARLDSLIARASATAPTIDCTAQDQLLERLRGATPQLSQRMRPDILCHARLLFIVKEQLGLLRALHRDGETCGPAHLSCLTPAATGNALAAANRTLRAVMVVELSKRKRP